MSILKTIAARTSAALRKLAAKQPASKTPNLSAPKAKPADKPYRIVVRNAAGDLESIPATREEALEYCNPESIWRRIV